MENLKLITSSRRLMALAALATGVALPPQSIMQLLQLRLFSSRVSLKVRFLILLVSR